MRRALLAVAASLWFCGGALPVLAQNGSAASAKPNLENGEYVFWAGGCASCHAAPASSRCDGHRTKDPLVLVGGQCLKTEFGTFYVPNISPDRETGIGDWTLEQFITAMTQGASPEGENYYPAFPYTSYQRMTRRDLTDLKAYLDTLPAVASTTPDHDLSFPYSIRSGLSVWKRLYLDGKPFQPDPTRSPQVNRGAYLVEGLGHCGECHTPRDSLGGMIVDKKMAGAPDPEGKTFTPNITPHETGIGSWSERDIAYSLESGFTPSGDVMGGVMAKVVSNMAKLTKEDREAIAAYLKSLPPIASSRPRK